MQSNCDALTKISAEPKAGKGAAGHVDVPAGDLYRLGHE
jgi:hypothetical protein